MALTITVIVCAYNEARYLPACLYSLRAQTRPADDIISHLLERTAMVQQLAGQGMP